MDIDELAAKVHLVYISNSESDTSDGSKSDDEELEALRPPPILIEDRQQDIVKISPFQVVRYKKSSNNKNMYSKLDADYKKSKNATAGKIQKKRKVTLPNTIVKSHANSKSKSTKSEKPIIVSSNIENLQNLSLIATDIVSHGKSIPISTTSVAKSVFCSDAVASTSKNTNKRLMAKVSFTDCNNFVESQSTTVYLNKKKRKGKRKTIQSSNLVLQAFDSNKSGPENTTKSVNVSGGLHLTKEMKSNPSNNVNKNMLMFEPENLSLSINMGSNIITTVKQLNDSINQSADRLFLSAGKDCISQSNASTVTTNLTPILYDNNNFTNDVKSLSDDAIVEDFEGRFLQSRTRRSKKKLNDLSVSNSTVTLQTKMCKENTNIASIDKVIVRNERSPLSHGNENDVLSQSVKQVKLLSANLICQYSKMNINTDNNFLYADKQLNHMLNEKTKKSKKKIKCSKLQSYGKLLLVDDNPTLQTGIINENAHATLFSQDNINFEINDEHFSEVSCVNNESNNEDWFTVPRDKAQKPMKNVNTGKWNDVTSRLVKGV